MSTYDDDSFAAKRDAAVQAQAENGPTIFCAWHPRYFSVELIIKHGDHRRSDGICRACKAIVEANQ